MRSLNEENEPRQAVVSFIDSFSSSSNAKLLLVRALYKATAERRRHRESYVYGRAHDAFRWGRESSGFAGAEGCPTR